VLVGERDDGRERVFYTISYVQLHSIISGDSELQLLVTLA
jgi:hypothetical protein